MIRRIRPLLVACEAGLRARNLVARWQQPGKRSPGDDPASPQPPDSGLAHLPNSRHGPAMFGSRQLGRAIACLVITVLVAASTVLPSVSYAQRYADHLAQYGGFDARAAAISGFAALYVDPRAAMLPVVLEANDDGDITACLPTPCSVEKVVLSAKSVGLAADLPWRSLYSFETYPVGLDPSALRGPPRSLA